jgi:hypothetical protein
MTEPVAFVQCPHCDMLIEILKLNCQIFRHGVFRSSGKQIPPHSTKKICDHLFTTGQIYGCGKPFCIVVETDQYRAEKCEYI